MLELSYFDLIRVLLDDRGPDLKVAAGGHLHQPLRLRCHRLSRQPPESRLRQAEVAIKDKSVELETAGAARKHRADPSRGGLITTDLKGEIAGQSRRRAAAGPRREEFTGHRVQELFFDPLPYCRMERRARSARSRTPGGAKNVGHWLQRPAGQPARRPSVTFIHLPISPRCAVSSAKSVCATDSPRSVASPPVSPMRSAIRSRPSPVR